MAKTQSDVQHRCERNQKTCFDPCYKGSGCSCNGMCVAEIKVTLSSSKGRRSDPWINQFTFHVIFSFRRSALNLRLRCKNETKPTNNKKQQNKITKLTVLSNYKDPWTRPDSQLGFCCAAGIYMGREEGQVVSNLGQTLNINISNSTTSLEFIRRHTETIVSLVYAGLFKSGCKPAERRRKAESGTVA